MTNKTNRKAINKKESPLFNQQNFSVSFDHHTAHVTFDMPNEKINKFNQHCLIELAEIIQKLEKYVNINTIIFKSNKPGIFIAGADIKEFLKFDNPNDIREKISSIQQLFLRISKLKTKTIALINGTTLGGGLEFALACDHIVVTDSPKVKLGLPEVNLGIIPGWGGTTRLPKRVGLINSLDYILTGKQMTGKKALKIGLADAIVPEEFQYDKLNELINNNQLKTKRKKRPFIEKIPGAKYIICHQARKKIMKKTKGKYPAPLKAVSVIRKTFRKSIKKGLEAEVTANIQLMQTDIAIYLINLFFSGNHVKKIAKKKPSSDLPLQNIGICGAGLMGGGIGSWFLMNQHDVRLKDISWEMIQKGYQTTHKIIQKKVKRKRIKPHEAQLMMDKLSSDLDYSGFKSIDLTIEAIPENMDLKKKIMNDIESQVSSQSIIASNTSSLSIDEIADTMKHPERFLGIHFFSPVEKMPLVEIIPSQHTSENVIKNISNMIVNHNKFPIIVKNCPGFLVNRILLPYVNEAVHLMVEGYKITDIDNICTQFGFPIGPLTLSDEVGLDVGANVLNSLVNGYGKRMAFPTQLSSMLDDGLLGKKTGKGFYVHSKKSHKMNTSLYKKHNITIKYRPSTSDKKNMLDRLILIMINEASRCIDENIVNSAELLDFSLIMGTGFPPFRGGLLRYADHIGISNIVDRLNKLSDTIDTRFTPSNYLESLNKKNKTFYAHK